jgi:hypothetical protein
MLAQVCVQCKEGEEPGVGNRQMQAYVTGQNARAVATAGKMSAEQMNQPMQVQACLLLG